jgi:hypothetical protein
MLIHPDQHGMMLYRIHPTKGWQYWTVTGAWVRSAHAHEHTEPASRYSRTTYSATWAEPEAGDLW